MPIARCQRALKQPQKAITALEKTLAVVPFHPRANYEMALAQLDAGNQAAAIEHLKRTVQVWSDADPSFKPAAAAGAKLKELGS